MMGADGEIDLIELIRLLWSGKLIVIGFAMLFAVASVIYALSLPNVYRSEALLAPVGDGSNGIMAGLGGQLGGIASLAGINLRGGSGDKTALAIEVLKSREFIAKFIQKYDLLVPLMAAKGWNPASDAFHYDNDIYDVAKNRWVREATLVKTSEPTAQESYLAFSGLLTVSQDKNTSYVTVAIDFYSPKEAKRWVDLLVQEINQEIKAREVREAESSVKYLTLQLEKTPLAGMKTVFYQLIEEQMKTVMFAEVRDEYVFTTIDPAIAPELKVKPKRVLILIMGTFLGAVVGVIFIVISVFRQAPK